MSETISPNLSELGRALVADCGRAHRWRVEEPNGRFVAGVCRQCGAEREFQTAGADAYESYLVGPNGNPEFARDRAKAAKAGAARSMAERAKKAKGAA